MSETINELYLKYANSIGASLEDDRYFRYLLEIVQAGNNVLQQNRQILHKVVDETWLTVIEESLDAINTIIDKPRRFVTTNEEVVPVALAKKITADSVRHLSMNTQFITPDDETGDIHPTHILNVSTEESYDLYENRFLYHLIQKLVTFIDKRTDVIFWSTGDEIRNTMVLESKIDDAYEEIEYKVEMRIKNRQSFAENDADNMDFFMRIDRVRRLTMALRTSAFCEIMNGCAKVRSPIQRTNLMMKDPNYRKCYNLWQFLERYDGVGYFIEEQNSALEFDEEYLLQIYINLITSYTVFKTLSEEEPRNLAEALTAHHQVLQPKFIKEIHEEIVDDYNIPDVEVRQVIIEEVTQAQLDAEARAEAEAALRQEAEKARDAAQEAAEEYMRQAQDSLQRMLDAQSQAAIAESMREAAEETARQEKMEREAAQAAKLEAENQREEAERERDAANARCRQAQEESTEARKQTALAQREREEAVCKAAESAAAQAAAELECASAVHNSMIAESARKRAEAACLEALGEKDAALASAHEQKQRMEEAMRRADAAEAESRERTAACDAAQKAKDEAVMQHKTAEKHMQKACTERDELRAQMDAAIERTQKAVNGRREAERQRAKVEKSASEERESLMKQLAQLRTQLEEAEARNAELAAQLAAEQEFKKAQGEAASPASRKFARMQKPQEDMGLLQRISRAFSGADAGSAESDGSKEKQ